MVLIIRYKPFFNEILEDFLSFKNNGIIGKLMAEISATLILNVSIHGASLRNIRYKNFQPT